MPIDATVTSPAALFRSGVDLVPLNVSVTDGDRRPVTGLPQDAFAVYEDGVRQTVALFESSACPLAVVILIDVSDSMQLMLADAQRAAATFVSQLRAGDIASVMSFESVVRVLAPFTPDRGRLTAAIRSATPGGPTALYDAIVVALSSLQQVPRPQPHQLYRKALVVLSDGENSAGLTTADEAIRSGQQGDANVYTIRLQDALAAEDGGRWSEATFVLGRLAQETGGLAFRLDGIRDLSATYAALINELGTLYTLAYVPLNPARDGIWRPVTVRVAHPGAQVRTRTGYVAPHE